MSQPPFSLPPQETRDQDPPGPAADAAEENPIPLIHREIDEDSLPDDWQDMAGMLPDRRRWLAWAALALGVANLCAWVFPLPGILLSLPGIALGVLGLGSNTAQRKYAALAGLGFSITGLALAVLNGLFGVFGIFWMWS